MSRSIVHSPQAPAPGGVYSQAVRSGSLLYTAGQLGLRPTDPTLPEGIEAQTRQALTNLRAVLEAGGATLGSVVKTTVFLADMADFEAFNRVYAEFFPVAPPARSTVAVAALPKQARVEIEAVAAVLEG